MGSIDTKKMVVAGLVAGVVFTLIDVASGALLFGGPMEAAFQARNLDMAALDGAIPWLIGSDMFFALMAAFVYAAIRPRFGAGPKTGFIAGLVVWAIGSCTAMTFSVMGFMPLSLTLAMTAVLLVAFLIVGYIVDRLYSE
ncbi:hypothetical protein DCC79_09120 [bacterium]|nr:hypothetical protein [Chloroflexi bacterium CFX6]RIL10067.1 MAG: hypothetical protein DCC79_09120 [bacterium]